VSETLSAAGERNCIILNVFEKKKKTDSQPKKTCTCKEEKERKNGIQENILLSTKNT
jgi:hypothetical protein